MTESGSRILHITRNLPPLVGGMERLNWHIANELARRANVHVIGPQGSNPLKPANVTLTESPLQPLRKFLLSSATKAVVTAKRIGPSVVLAGSGLTAPAALLAARVSRARAVVYLHGLDVAVRHPVYRTLWRPAIRCMDVVIANSHPTADLAKKIGVKEERIKVVHPGVILPAAPQPARKLQEFRDRYGLSDAPIILSVGRLSTRKGLREFVQNALPDIVAKVPDVQLVIVGDAPSAALKATAQTRQSIQEVADARGVGTHLSFLGVITDPSELACAYESAAVHVFPVRQVPDDPEGFGMVAIEAAAHGLPTAAFATGGIVDAVSDGQSGRLIRPGDYTALSNALVQMLTESRRGWGKGARAFADKFDWSSFGAGLWEALAPIPER